METGTVTSRQLCHEMSNDYACFLERVVHLEPRIMGMDFDIINALSTGLASVHVNCQYNAVVLYTGAACHRH
jgi:hypothetical protein